MQGNTSPNNASWHESANLSYAREYYPYGELNAWTTTSAMNMEAYVTPEVSLYRNGDLGNSLQSVKDEGNLKKARTRKIVRTVSLVGMATLSAAAILNYVNGYTATLSSSSVTLDGSTLAYSYVLTCAHENELTVALFSKARSESATYTIPEGHSGDFRIDGSFLDVSESYEVTLVTKSAFRTTTLSKSKGTIA